jgi:amino acid transporter
MTPQDHNKALGIMHLIYGGFFGLMTVMMAVVFAFVGIGLGASAANDPNGPPAGFFIAIFGFIVVLYGLLSIPSLVAGYGMLKRRSWARTAGIVASVLSAMSFPFGTALCVYTLWFLFGGQGQDFYRGGYDLPPAPDWRGSLREGSPYDWEAQRAQASSRPREYAPPRQPPDWRG